MDPATLKQLLQAALQPDTKQVKDATTRLEKDYYSDPASLSVLLQLAVSQTEPRDLRQIAATQARNLVPRHWASLPDAQKPAVRTHLLQATLHESQDKVRHALASIVAAIAKRDLADGDWEDLPAAMVQAASSSQVHERQVGTYIILNLLEEMPEEQKPQYRAYLELFRITLADAESSEVRLNTVVALAKIAEAIDGDDERHYVSALHKLLPGMVRVLQDAVQQENEIAIEQCFGSFQDLLDADSRVLGQHFRDVVQLMAEIANRADASKDARAQALRFLESAVFKRKAKFQALKISGDIVRMLWSLMINLADREGLDAEDGVARSALELLTMLAYQLPPKQVVQPVIEALKKYANSNNPRERQVSISALGACIDGAPDYIDSHLGELLPLVLKFMQDSDVKVREAGLQTFSSLADELSDSIAKHHQETMSVLAMNLNAAMQNRTGEDAKVNESIARTCCTSIEALVHGIPARALEGYVGDLVPHLSQLFSDSDAKVRSAAIGAVGAIASQAGKMFLPYFDKTMHALQEYVQVEGSEEKLELRAITLDAMGEMATAVGPEAFQPYVEPLMKSTEQGLQLDSSILKESSYMFWGALARVYKEDFSTFLPGITETIFTLLKDLETGAGDELGDDEDEEHDLDDPGVVDKIVSVKGLKAKLVATGVQAEQDEEADDVEEVELDTDLNDLSALADLGNEEQVALESLAEVFGHVGKAFVPYFPKLVETVIPLTEYPFDNIKVAAFGTLFSAYEALWKLQPEAQQKWERGLPLQIKPIDEVQKLANVIMVPTLAHFVSEQESEVLAPINESFAHTLRECGPHLLSGDGVLKKVTQVMLSILAREHPCQDESDVEEDNEDGESNELSFYVVDSAMDVLAGLAHALGPQFGELWKMFSKPMLAYATSSSAGQRGSAIGALAEVIKGMKGGATPFATSLMPVILKALDDDEASVQSNAAYAAGLLIQYADADFKQAYPVLFNTLGPALTDTDDDADGRLRDNAAGCLARIIARNPAAVPLGKVLPLLVEALPLEDDYEENQPVWDLLVALYKDGDDNIQRLTPQVMEAAASVLSDPPEQLSDDTRAGVVQLVRYVHGKKAELVTGHPSLMAILS